ncbi:LysR family transcriptional regulator [Desulfitobacterium chlororespirans]|uniref:DNA-binding transcriptional regulator, LysR family n=1 Tax=Desulfitobacterium chlororespirans DSM 11544 TaxID=1121395 RepID=A0A1M7SNC2_9FIRM|nr:LysR family transcriptional regulator [Desulfitobacterium chlororespirans]SHN59950.1 DNA-binding transcriptional regulator, LysR family [Desulfitobacterium chlororespirans DSM 11544]
MNNEHLRSFISIVDKGSINKAAEAKYISPQALLKQINALERDTGLQLLIRTPKGIIPTSVGREFYKGAQQMLALSQQVLSHCKEIDGNDVAIRILQVPFSLSMHKVYSVFAERHPKIQQQFITSSNKTNIENVLSGVADISEWAHLPQASLHGLEFIPLVRQHRVCLLAKTHPYAAKNMIRLSELADQRVVVNNLSWMPELAAAMEQEVPGFKFIEISCEIESVFNVCFANGIYLIPHCYTSYFAPLVSVPLDVPFQWDFGLIWRKSPSAAVEKFIKVAKEVCQNE